MAERPLPALSVIVVTPDGYDTVRHVVRRLAQQTAAALLELVVVAPRGVPVEIDEVETASFAGLALVEVDTVSSTAAARAAGIRAASASIVALAEDHSFPHPTWAEALISAHRGPWAAVGPAIGNANPGSATSWANLLIEYGEFVDPPRRRTAALLPGHNSSYKRDVLLAYGERLAAMLEAESVLHWDLRSRGWELLLEPAARTDHLNYSSRLSWLPMRFYAGRLFAAARSRDWPAARRLLYAGGAPLIPAVRLARVMRMLAGSPSRALLPRVLPALVLGLVVDGAGELVGYVCGPGNAVERASETEFHRVRHLSDRDSARLALR